MPRFARSLAFVLFLACAGCSRPADLSESRRDFLLAGPHGWIDLVVHAPVRGAEDAKAGASCRFELEAAGEPLTEGLGDLARADAEKVVRGYRVLAPAGALTLAFVVDTCLNTARRIEIPLQLPPDHLAELTFDGERLVPGKVTPYAPATLELLHAALARLHDDARERARADHGSARRLTVLAGTSVLLNLVLVGLLLAQRRRRADAPVRAA